MAAYGESGSGLLIIERILRDRESIWRQIGEERDLGKLTKQMLYTSVAALACYGAVLGASASIAQAALSAAKLPLLFLMTLAICLPTLYLFNLVFGARLQVKQALSLVMVTITVTSVLSLAFAPISLFFRITAFSYDFYKLLNVAILTMTAFVGLRFLTSGMRALNEHTAALAETRRQERERGERAAAAAEAALSAPVTTDTSSTGAASATGSTAGSAAADGEAAEGEQAAGGDPGAAVPTSPAPAPVVAPVSAVPVSTVPISALPATAGVPNGLVATLVAPPHPTAMQGQPLLMPDGRTAYPVPYPQPVPMMRPAPRPEPQPAPGERPASMTLLNVWILLFGFVGTQLAWTLRPFVGSPDEPFAIFRKIEGNFYVEVVRAIGRLFT
ncbi:hypothetical protein ABT297_00825 [Dactylosporangium sp. NPDC000555]|uniref:hypothetical protein n=1 Tax=Dactylosporangium sp. NPDC000555 TaxID=3154260 RepID=UPI00331AC299